LDACPAESSIDSGASATLATAVQKRMLNPLDHPFLILAISLPTFWLFALTGAWLHKRARDFGQDSHDDFQFVLGGTLTLLALIVGFTFSMAVNRYDQRKNYEEQEANAIGTEYVRADLLPSADGAKVRALLRSYLDQRILNYKSRDAQQLRRSDTETARLQIEMWAAVAIPNATHLSPVTALAVAGMNDVLNSQGYTQAAWWNRIPVAAWIMMAMMSVLCNLLIGYVAYGRRRFVFFILPVALAIAFFLIADIDSPRGGVIVVEPQNLESVAESLHSP